MQPSGHAVRMGGKLADQGSPDYTAWISFSDNVCRETEMGSSVDTGLILLTGGYESLCCMWFGGVLIVCCIPRGSSSLVCGSPLHRKRESAYTRWEPTNYLF